MTLLVQHFVENFYSSKSVFGYFRTKKGSYGRGGGGLNGLASSGGTFLRIPLPRDRASGKCPFLAPTKHNLNK